MGHFVENGRIEFTNAQGKLVKATILRIRRIDDSLLNYRATHYFVKADDMAVGEWLRESELERLIRDGQF